MNEGHFPGTFPVLETERLTLRAITDRDHEAIFKNFSDPDVAKWFFDVPLSSMDQATHYIKAFSDEFQQGEGITWAIALKPTDGCIGTCSLTDIVLNDRAETGFDLAKAHWRKGLMSEALGAMISYGFTALNLSVIEADVFSENAAARGLLEKLGFQVVKVEQGSHFYSLSQ